MYTMLCTSQAHLTTNTCGVIANQLLFQFLVGVRSTKFPPPQFVQITLITRESIDVRWSSRRQTIPFNLLNYFNSRTWLIYVMWQNFLTNLDGMLMEQTTSIVFLRTDWNDEFVIGIMCGDLDGMANKMLFFLRMSSPWHGMA